MLCGSWRRWGLSRQWRGALPEPVFAQIVRGTRPAAHPLRLQCDQQPEWVVRPTGPVVALAGRHDERTEKDSRRDRLFRRERRAEETNAELIVIGTHGRRGLAHVMSGSVAERVVQHAGCPVLTVPFAKKAA